MSVIVHNWTESDGRNPVVLFENLLANATPIGAGSTGRPDLVTDSTYDGHNITTDINLNYDMGAPSKDFNAVALVGHRFASLGVSVNISESLDGVTWKSITGAKVIPQDGTTLVVFNNQNRRYVRIRLLSDSPVTGMLRHIRVGKLLEMEGGVAYNYTPIWMAQERELLVSKSMNGQFINNRVVSKGAKTDIPLLSIDRSFVEDDLQPFMEHYNDGKPFVFASGPTVFGRDVAYSWRQDGAEMKPTFDQSGNWMSLTMSIEGYVQ